MATILALLSSLLWGSADYHAGNLSKRHPALVILAINQFFGLLVGIGILIATGTWITPTLHNYFIPGVLAGLSGYAGLLCLYAGLSTGRMGVVAPISSLSAIIPLAYAFTVKGDRLSQGVMVGVIAATVGGFLASGPEIKGRLPLKPVILALGAAFGFGIALSFMAIGSQSHALLTMVSMRSASLVVSAVLLLRRGDFGGVTPKTLPLLFAIGAADFSANLLLGIATTKGLVSLAMVLGSLYPIVTAILAFAYLQERLHRVQYLGVLLAVGGVALISALQ
jgi:drug/metabolite transporter (DMT)-like permease